MLTPSPAQLLEAWERAQSRPPAERAAAFLPAFDAELTPEACAGLPLGMRDSQLLAWREQTFGSQLNCLANCPHCGKSVEFSMRSEELRFPAPASEDVLSLSRDGWALTFRLPNTADLAAVASERDPAAARLHLFARCLFSATGPDGRDIDASAVPDELVCATGERMAEADSCADLSFALRCPLCVATWEVPFDAAGFFWQELSAWARRLLHDVHELASAYSWSEAEILALSPVRRQVYLDLIDA